MIEGICIYLDWSKVRSRLFWKPITECWIYLGSVVSRWSMHVQLSWTPRVVKNYYFFFSYKAMWEVNQAPAQTKKEAANKRIKFCSMD